MPTQGFKLVAFRRGAAESAAFAYVAGRYAPEDEREAFMKQLAVAPPLSPEEMTEREKLLSEGFTNWTYRSFRGSDGARLSVTIAAAFDLRDPARGRRKDLNNFVRGLEEFGRTNLNDVATFVEGKSTKEVAQYAVSFFERCDAAHPPWSSRALRAETPCARATPDMARSRIGRS